MHYSIPQNNVSNRRSQRVFEGPKPLRENHVGLTVKLDMIDDTVGEVQNSQDNNFKTLQ